MNAQSPFHALEATRPVMGLMLRLSVVSAAILAFLLWGGGAPIWTAAAAVAYGLGAAEMARRWRRLDIPTGREWLAGTFFGVLPLLYGLASGAEGSIHG